MKVGAAVGLRILRRWVDVCVLVLIQNNGTSRRLSSFGPLYGIRNVRKPPQILRDLTLQPTAMR